MKLLLNDGVVISTVFNDGSEYFWNAAIYSKIKDLNTRSKTLFKEVNQFIEWLPNEKVKAIEQFYHSVQSALLLSNKRFVSTQSEFLVVLNDIRLQIVDAARQMFDVVTIETIQAWCSQYDDLYIPELAEEHNSIYTIAGTYLKSDYVDLVGFCIAVRLMVPVWCEYINIISDLVAPNKCEVSCFELLSGCHGLLNSAAVIKLRAYIDEKAHMELQKAATAVINGLSRSEVAEWILSNTVVRRISIGDLSSNDARGHLITSIYGYVQGILNRDLDRKNAGRVREKFKTEVDTDTGEEKSQIEQYRIKQDVSTGDVVSYETYILRYPERAATDLISYRQLTEDDKKTYLKKVDICIQYVDKINTLDLIFSQKAILGWIVNDIVPYKMIDHLNMKVLRKLIGIAQAYAWHFNLPDVAIALTAMHNTEIENNMLINVPSARVSPNMYQRLSALYGFNHPISTKVDDEEEKRNNVAVKALRNVIKGLNSGLFTARIPDELWTNAASHQKSGCIVFKNISDQLVTLIETLNEAV